jgi:2-polyprenyl-3-methyl-5-hydroxy-6-metoxy-1,4-benzoquinol methylase
MATRAQPKTPCPMCDGAPDDVIFTKDGYELVRCRSCRLVRVANPPARDELERFYSFEAGYGIEQSRGVGSEAWLRGLAAYHLSLLPANRSGRLLDVGCGVGYFVAEARKAGWAAEGIDLNADVAEIARERAGLPVERGRIDDLDVPPESFDAVTLWDSLEHVEDPRMTLVAARRILRTGGLLAVSTPNIDGLFPRLSYPVGRATGYWTHPEPPAHLFQFSTATLTLLLERTGFQVDRVVHDRSPLKYTLAPGGLRLLARHPGRILYAAAFLPAVLLGPRVQLGDQITVIASAV